MSTFLKISQQTLWQLAGKLVSSVFTLITLAVVARFYGEEGIGVFALALAYLAIFNLAADLGFNAYILPKLDSTPAHANKLFNVRLVWSLGLVVLACLLSPFLPFTTPLFVQSVYFGSATILFSGVFNTTNLIFQKNLRYDLSIVASSSEALIKTGLIFTLSYFRLPVSFLFIGMSLAALINNAISFYLVRGLYRFSLEPPDLKFALSSLKVAWPIAATLIFNVLYFRLDTFILSTFMGVAAVGIYNLAYQFFQAALVLPAFVMNSFYPVLVKSHKDSPARFLNQVKLVALSLLAISGIGVVLTWMLAPYLINLLAGNAFTGSVASLKLLSLGFPAYFLSALLMWVMIVMQKYRLMLFIYLIGLFINVALNLIYIPRYSYLAASLITGVSEYLILLIQIIMLIFVFKSNR